MQEPPALHGAQVVEGMWQETMSEATQTNWFVIVFLISTCPCFIRFRGLVIDTRALSNFQRFPTAHSIQSIRLGYLWIVTPFMFPPQSWLQDRSLRGLSVLSFRDTHPSLAFECLMRFTRLWRALLWCPLLSLPFIYAPVRVPSSTNWLPTGRTRRFEFLPKIFYNVSTLKSAPWGAQWESVHSAVRQWEPLLDLVGTRSCAQASVRENKIQNICLWQPD